MTARYFKSDPERTVVYPSGMIHRTEAMDKGRRHIKSVHCDAGRKLFLEITNSPVQPTIKQICAVSDIMVELGWNVVGTALQINQGNSLLKGRYRQFVQDTLRFIMTGQREYSMMTWNTLLRADINELGNSWDDQQEGTIKEEDIIDIVSVNSYAGDVTYVARWLKQENGFDDMLWTMRLLYCDPDTTIW